jgi:hypothetical protein
VGVHLVSGAAATITGTGTGNDAPWVFVGPTAKVNLTSDQVVSGSLTAVLGVNAGSSAAISVDLCYRPPLSNEVNAFYGSSEVNTQLDGPKRTVTYTSAMGGLLVPATDYTVGLCVRNGSNVNVDQNDYVTGWFMVTNGMLIPN